MKIQSKEEKTLNKVIEITKQTGQQSTTHYPSLDNLQKKTKLIIDGNNLLFIKNQIRNAAIKKHTKAQANQMLAQFILTHIKFQGNILIIYDQGKQLPDLKSDKFQIKIARPHFKTADDMIALLAAQQKNKQQLLVVTTDRGLIQRVLAQKVEIMKGGHFMKLIQKS